MKTFFRKMFFKRGNFLLLSSIILLLIFTIGGIVFVNLMSRIMVDNVRQDLIMTLELERLKLAVSINSEIAIVLKMAESPLIKRYFSNPRNVELERIAFEEFAAYRRVISENSIFWVNDTDKIFYTNANETYLIDPDIPENYWYPMTLYETEIYNFNINYNPDLNLTNLWINAPVFDANKNAIGIVGTGINLSDFINPIYNDSSGKANMYFFNAAREITGARDIALVENKTGINEELGNDFLNILNEIDNIKGDEVKHFYSAGMKGVAVIGAVKELNWYIVVVQRVSVINSLQTGMTVLFAAIMIVMIIIVYSVFAVQELKLGKARAEAARGAVVSSLEYAGIIQQNMLPSNKIFQTTFSDYGIVWKPRDIVGGDIYWIKNFEEGAVLCVCDCTGHGTPGALLSMLVVATFEATVTEYNYKDTAQIIWELERKLIATLNAKSINNEDTNGLNIKDGCDLVVVYIGIDGNVHSSSCHTHIFVCDGKDVLQIKGQKIFVGEGRIKSKDEIQTKYFTPDPGNKFYIASDGLFDQPGGEESVPFGYNKFKKIILENHNESQSVICEKVWSAYEKHRGEISRVDDFELIGFKLKNAVRKWD